MSRVETKSQAPVQQSKNTFVDTEPSGSVFARLKQAVASPKPLHTTPTIASEQQDSEEEWDEGDDGDEGDEGDEGDTAEDWTEFDAFRDELNAQHEDDIEKTKDEKETTQAALPVAAVQTTKNQLILRPLPAKGSSAKIVSSVTTIDRARDVVEQKDCRYCGTKATEALLLKRKQQQQQQQQQQHKSAQRETKTTTPAAPTKAMGAMTDDTSKQSSPSDTATTKIFRENQQQPCVHCTECGYGHHKYRDSYTEQVDVYPQCKGRTRYFCDKTCQLYFLLRGN